MVFYIEIREGICDHPFGCVCYIQKSSRLNPINNLTFDTIPLHHSIDGHIYIHTTAG